MNSWKKLSNVDFDELYIAKDCTHLAIQNVSAFARSYTSRKSGDDAGSLYWMEDVQRLAGNWIETAHGKIRSSFSFTHFAIYLIDEQLKTISEFKLDGKKHTDVMVWLEEQVAFQHLNIASLAFNLPYDLPVYHRLGDRTLIKPDESVLSELLSYFHNCQVVGSALIEKNNLSSDMLKCSPETFNYSLKIPVKQTGPEETFTHIILGLCPGNELEKEPYFFITSWPYVKVNEISAPLTQGKWVDDLWSGAKLPIHQLSGVDTSEEQFRIAVKFFDEAIEQLKPHLKN